MNAIDERYLLQLRRGPKRTGQIVVYARLNELVVFRSFSGWSEVGYDE